MSVAGRPRVGGARRPGEHLWDRQWEMTGSFPLLSPVLGWLPLLGRTLGNAQVPLGKRREEIGFLKQIGHLGRMTLLDKVDLFCAC